MGAKSSIEWTGASWNAIKARRRATGKVGWFCIHKSSGCTNCYAEAMNKWRGNGAPYTAPALKDVEIFLDEKTLTDPLRWREPRKIFVCSMTDLFGEFVPDEFIDRIFAVMASAGHHTFQVLTKRPERMLAYLRGLDERAPEAGAKYERQMREHFERYKMDFREGYSLPDPPTPHLRAIYDVAATAENRPTNPTGETLQAGFSGGEYHWRPWPLSNVHLGVSVENQATADERIPLLLQTPATVRWISYEPGLGPVDLEPYFYLTGPSTAGPWEDALGRKRGGGGVGGQMMSRVPSRDISWVVCGGESGPSARPFDLAWARSVIEQCREADVRAYMKQMGSVPMILEAAWQAHVVSPLLSAKNHARVPDGWVPLHFNDRKGADPSEWSEEFRIREFPTPRSNA